MKTPLKYLYFLEEDVVHLEENILTVSQEYIDGLMTKYYADAFKLAMLEELLIHVKEREEYYYNKQHDHYDRVALKSAIIYLIISLVLVGLVYCCYKYYHLPKDREMQALIEELKSYGITITEHSKNAFRGRVHWLEINKTEEYFPIDLYDKIKSMREQIYTIHSTLYGEFEFIIVALGSGALYTIHTMYTYIKNCCKPQYKERYEKFAWLETKIEQRIASVKENSPLYRLKRRR
jgi:hypothetical protein